MKAEYDLSTMKSRRNPYASKLKRHVRLLKFSPRQARKLRHGGAEMRPMH